jgi:protein-L-isoaspartate(D-aspartate) O-methyltransferase
MVMGLRRAGVSDPRVLGVMEQIERERYVPEAWRMDAYEDAPLPIGHGQTISQPAVVGAMLQALDVGPKMRVLEIGVGSGYQTAALAGLARAVFGVERIKALLSGAKTRLQDQKIDNVFLRWADGGKGWPEGAPFDRIIAAAAANDMPGALADQLKPGGVMVLPLGSEGRQSLWRIRRDDVGFTTEDLGAVAFVPFLPGAIEANHVAEAASFRSAQGAA